MTGREYLMTLTDNELAWVIKRGGENIDDLCMVGYKRCQEYKNCIACITTWLKSERGGLVPKYKVGDTVYAIGRMSYSYLGYLPVPCKITKVNINKYSISYKLIQIGEIHTIIGAIHKECYVFPTENDCKQGISELGWKLLPELTEENKRIAKEKITEAAQNPLAYNWVKSCAKQIKNGDEIRTGQIYCALCGTLTRREK